MKRNVINKSKWRHATTCNDFLQNNSLQFVTASKGALSYKNSQSAFDSQPEVTRRTTNAMYSNVGFRIRMLIRCLFNIFSYVVFFLLFPRSPLHHFSRKLVFVGCILQKHILRSDASIRCYPKCVWEKILWKPVWFDKYRLLLWDKVCLWYVQKQPRCDLTKQDPRHRRL